VRGVVIESKPLLVGWLRLQDARKGAVAGVALVESMTDGEPVRFSLASTPKAVDGTRNAVGVVVAELLRSRSHELAFVVAQPVELERTVAASLGVPVAYVQQPASGLGAWATPPDDATERALVRVRDTLSSEDILARVATAAAVAFDDPRVFAMTHLAGFVATLTLRLGATTRGGPDSGDDLASRLSKIPCPSSAGPDTPLPGDAGPLEWPAPLMPFQRVGVRALLEMDRLLLADDMGLGKTVQAIAALRIRRASGELGPALVVAPTSLLDQWRRELARWAPELSAIIVRGATGERSWKWRATPDVTLTSYGVLRADAWRPEVRRRWATVVLDEAQRIKNRIETSDVVKRLRRSRSWALTGTPVENREDELASIMEFVDHDGQLPLRHFAPGEELRRRHRALQLRRRKADVLSDLPPKLVSTRQIELTPAQRASYARAERDGVVFLRSLGADVSIVHVLELITRLKQICNADPMTGASCKLDDIAERIAELTSRGHKAVVFSQYTSETSGVGLAAARLAEFHPLTLTGKTPVGERPSLVDTFRDQRKHRVLIVSLGVGGVGLNLQEASYVLHLDRWWNPAVERQAEDRVHRIGQTVKVHVVKYTCIDTIEERIETVLGRKQALFDELVDDVSLDLSTQLSREELLGLFDL